MFQICGIKVQSVSRLPRQHFAIVNSRNLSIVYQEKAAIYVTDITKKKNM